MCGRCCRGFVETRIRNEGTSCQHTGCKGSCRYHQDHLRSAVHVEDASRCQRWYCCYQRRQCNPPWVGSGSSCCQIHDWIESHSRRRSRWRNDLCHCSRSVPRRVFFFLLKENYLLNLSLLILIGWMKIGGEMLHVAEAFIEKSYHPTVICRGNLTGSTSFLFIIKLIGSSASFSLTN